MLAWWRGHLNRRRFSHYLALAQKGGFESIFRVEYLRTGGHCQFHHQSPSQIKKAYHSAKSKGSLNVCKNETPATP